jgi:uncharacterized damage-inducible protein DinB
VFREMETLSTFAELFRYNDHADRMVFTAAAKLSNEQLDRALDLGLGSVRRICRHMLAGEATWLSRMSGTVEARWPNELQTMPIADMLRELEQVWLQRNQFIATLTPQHLDRMQEYRDSKGSLFRATLSEMLIQCTVHSTHHRAQVVNGIRRVGGKPPEVDYMYFVRKPA